jgi:transcriptional regulator with XRE-family HTH domain
VADDAYGATVAKRRLSRHLVALRERSGLRVDAANDKLGWSRGRLARFERNEWRLPDASYIRDLARIYGASDHETAELEELGARARQRVWWRADDDVFGKRDEFPGFENDAARISVCMPLVLPGLLQTEAYARALLAVSAWSADWQEKALAARLRRQQILDRADGTAPRLIAVITEAALMYRWGTAADRRAQLDHLAQMSRRPGVELRLRRFADGLHPGMSSLINIFDFPDDEDPSIVYVENDTVMQEVTRPAEVGAYQQTFARIRESALTAAATRDYLGQLTTLTTQE